MWGYLKCAVTLGLGERIVKNNRVRVVKEITIPTAGRGNQVTRGWPRSPLATRYSFGGAPSKLRIGARPMPFPTPTRWRYDWLTMPPKPSRDWQHPWLRVSLLLRVLLTGGARRAWAEVQAGATVASRVEPIGDKGEPRWLRVLHNYP